MSSGNAARECAVQTRGAVAVFVKTPGLSAVKTRLAATLGRPQAEHFFRLARTATEAVLTAAQKQFAEHDIELEAYWAIAEPEAIDHALWQSDTMQRMHTGPGGLGERLHHVYSTLLTAHDFVLLIGMDSPQNDAAKLMRAADYLSHTEKPAAVFGPARDGGFYLFGGNAPLGLKHWMAVEYSADDTLVQLLSELDGLEVATHPLDWLTDVDTEADLWQLCAEMDEQALPEQQAVCRWVAGLAAKATD